MNKRRALKRIIFIFLAGIAAFCSAVVILLWKYEDKIIALAIREINKKANTEITAGSVDLSFRKFPDLSIRFSDAVVKSSLSSDDTLAHCGSIYCSFRFWDIVNKNFHITQVWLEDGAVDMARWGDSVNYEIIKPSQEKKNSALSFSIRDIGLNNMQFQYRLPDKNQRYAFDVRRASAAFRLKKNVFYIQLKGDMASREITVGDKTYAKGTPFRIQSDFSYENEAKSLQIGETTIALFGSDVSVEGRVGADDFHIRLEGEETDIRSLLSLLPEEIDGKLKAYRSDGDVRFEAEVSGAYAEGTPYVHVDFRCRNARFYHPEYDESIKKATLSGSYDNGLERTGKTSNLYLEHASGELNGKPFSGSLEITNFDDPYLAFDLKADLDLGSLLKFIPYEKATEASGEATADVKFSGRLSDLKEPGRLDKISSEGEIDVKNLDFRLKDVNLDFRNFSGNLLFRNDAVAVSDFSGRIADSDFLINGFVKNLLAYLLFENAPLVLEADLASERIMMGELLSGVPSAAAEEDQAYRFRVSPRLNIDFNCDVKYLEFERFKAEGIKGQLKVAGQKATSRGITFHSAGGSMALHGSLDARKENEIKIFTTTKLTDIDIDQLFYVFKDFNQNFLTHHHLKGQIYADINTYLVLDSELRLASEELISDIGISIRNGELNNFEPMKRLSKYVEEKSLERLRFSDLKNQILVQNRQIYLPPMDVSSNITTIQVSGKHTFDQDIDYHVKIPLKRFNKRERDERFGYVKDDGQGNLHLFLKIQGKTADYKISYDGDAWRQNFTQSLKDEGEELKKAFQNKGRPEKEVTELNEEEYFDF